MTQRDDFTTQWQKLVHQLDVVRAQLGDIAARFNCSDECDRWLVSYGFAGEQWGMSVRAASADEAMERLRAAAQWGRVDGELIMKIPAVTGSWLPSLIIGIRNFFTPGK